MKSGFLEILVTALFCASVGYAQQPITQDQSTQNSDAVAGLNSTLVDEKLLQQLNQDVARFVAENKAVGAEIFVVLNGKALLHDAHGFSDQEDETKWKPDTICNIRSMSKPITSAAAQILIDEGKLKLDEPVATYLESFDNEKSRSITVRQVLTHRSGLPLTNLLMPYQYKNLDAQVAAAAKKGPEFEPGSKFWYSDTGTDVVAGIVEKITGEKIDEFVTRKIFKPLGMTNTFYGIDGDDQRLKSAASLYLRGTDKWTRFWKAGGRPMYPFAWGSQTVYSTTSDYAKFLTMLMNQGRAGEERILSEMAVTRMMEPVSVMKMMGADAAYPTGFNGLTPHYGQMLVTYRDTQKKDTKAKIFGHSGSDGTAAWAIPEQQLVVVYFTQSRGGRSVLTIEESIDDYIVNRGENIGNEVPEELKPFLGDYLANFATFKNETFTVRYRKGHLILDVPSQLAFKLLPADDQGLFPFEVLPDKSKVKFVIDENGKVTGLELHQAGKVFSVPRKDAREDDKK